MIGLEDRRNMARMIDVAHRDGARLSQACKLAGRITPARDVDHVINKAAGGTDDPGNLQALCKPCHDGAKQRQDNAAR